MKLLGSLMAAAAMVAAVSADSEASSLRGLSTTTTPTCTNHHQVVLRLDDIQDTHLVDVQLAILTRLRMRQIRYSASIYTSMWGGHQQLLDDVKGDWLANRCEVMNGGSHDGQQWHNMSYAQASKELYVGQMALHNSMGAWPNCLHPHSAYSRDVLWSAWKWGMAGVSDNSDCGNSTTCFTQRPVWQAPSQVSCDNTTGSVDYKQPAYWGGMRHVQVSQLVQTVEYTATVKGFAVLRLSPYHIANADGNADPTALYNYEELLHQLQSRCIKLVAAEDLTKTPRHQAPVERKEEEVTAEREVVDGHTVDAGAGGDVTVDGDADEDTVDGNTDGDEPTIAVYDDTSVDDVREGEFGPMDSAAGLAASAGVLAGAAMAALFVIA